MFRNEIEAQISELRKQLIEYKSKKKKAENEQDDLEEVIGRIKMKEREIEDGLQETVNNIEKKLKNINQKSRFKTRYLENAKNMLFNSDSSTALQGTRDAERKAMYKYYVLDDKISEYRRKIFTLESKINELAQQLE